MSAPAAAAAPAVGASAVDNGGVVIPISSPHDPHAYRITTLQNGLTCMLINDKPKSAVEREREAAAKQRKQKAGSSGSGADSTSGGASDDRDDGEESELKPAVVALSVRVGHWSDPAAIPGLAHFLEHMLFMGNQQFPSENEWEEYLSGHGGASNAFTDSEYTCYYFEINPAFLHPALQRFAQFFVSPLFAASATKREIRAVDSEFQDCINSDPERVSELLNYTAGLVNESHPFSKWGWGSKESLETNLKPKKGAAAAAAPAGKGAKGKGKGAAAAAAASTSAAAAAPAIDLRTELKAFHARYYSSHAMKLVVYNAGGKLDKLQRWVETEFAAIKHNQMPLVDFSHCGHPFRSLSPSPSPEAEAAAVAVAKPAPAAAAAPVAGKGKGNNPKNVVLSAPPAPRSCLQQFFYIVPIKEIYKLNLSWVLTPSLQPHYASKPLHYAEHLLGHEGSGSLYSLLRDRGWITSLVAGVNESGNHKNSAFELMQLSVSMTQGGSAHVEEIIDLVFQYLSLIRQPANVQEGIWGELKALSEIGFLFSEAQEPSEMVQDHAMNLHVYPEAHVVLGDYLHDTWDGDLVSRVLAGLSVENCRVDVVSPAYKAKPGLLKAPWFHTQYCSEAIPGDLLAKWARYDAAPELIDERLHLPRPNQFVPTDFAIRQHVSLVDRERSARNAGPQRICLAQADSSAPAGAALRGEYWWHLDSTFQLPRAHVHLLLESPVVYASAQHVALGELLLKVWVDYLSEYSYAASLAEMEFSVDSLRSGIEFKFAGFNHKLPAFVEKVVGALGELEQFLSEDPLAATRFASLKEKTTRHFAHLYYVPLKQANHARLAVLQQQKYSVESITAASKDASVPALLAFIRELRGQVRLVGLVDGNVARLEAEGMFAAVERAVVLDGGSGGEKAAAFERRVERTLMLPQGHTLYVEQRARNTRESNHALEAYFAIGPASVATRAVLNMLESLMAEPAFDQLRTKEQLGYKVQTGTRNTHGVLGFVVAVQSSAYEPLHLTSRVHAFLFHIFYPYLLGMGAAKFATAKASLIAEFLYADSALSERIERQWEEISDQKSCVFARPQLNAQQLHTVTHQQVVEFFEHYFLGIREHPPVPAPVSDLVTAAESGMAMELDAALPAPSPSPNAAARDAGDAVLPEAVSALQLSPAEEEAKRKEDRKNSKKQRKAAAKGGAAPASAAADAKDAVVDAEVSAKVALSRQAPILYRRAMVVCIYGHSKTKKAPKRGGGGDKAEEEEEEGEDEEDDQSGSEEEEHGEDEDDEDESGEDEEEEEEEEGGADASGDDEDADPNAPAPVDSLWLTPDEWQLLLQSQLQKETDSSAAEVAPRPLKKQKNGRHKQTATTPAAAPTPAAASFTAPPRVQLQLDDGVSRVCACTSAAGSSSASAASGPAAAPAHSHPALAQGEHAIRLRTFAALEAAKQAATFYEECNGPEKDLPANARAEC